uniref:RING-type domain-containing protein n=1 Tax=Plectus sambesii TaxID=2011161 RepID=A0A914W704_9BILA
MGQMSSKRQKGRQALRPEIDDAERLTIDSACLHCPVCLNVFATAPVVFECGHSVCASCTRRIVTSSIIRSQEQKKYYECPLCRKKLSTSSTLITNYTIETILDSIAELAEDATVAGADSNARFDNERLKIRLVDAERDKNIAVARAERAERHNFYYQIAISSLVMLMFYATIIGKILTSK